MISDLMRLGSGQPFLGIFDDLFDWPRLDQVHRSCNLDVQETDEQFILTADAPGVEKDDLDITLEDEVLTIRFKRDETDEQKKGDFHMRERKIVEFSRSCRLRGIYAESVDAKLKSGVITIRVNKSQPKRKACQIEIK